MARLLGGEHEADDGRKQRNTFDERREDQGIALDRVGSLGLTRDAFAGGAADATDDPGSEAKAHG